MDQQSSAMAVIDGVAVPACFPAAPVLIGSEVYRHSIYGRRHPLSIARVSATLDLIAALGWHDPAGYIDSPLASADALARFHTPEYIAAIMDAEATGQVAPEVRDRFNIGRNGNPVFPEIFRRPATAAGASSLAAQMLAGVAGGTVYSPAGGTHHGRADQASGFCYFNDPVLAILTLRDAGIRPILYVDLDAHHGDGVEAAFAADEQVLTVSIH
ncbi:MAG: acetoin utilization protein AcuC, partial [Pseudomonadota bacterium]|nr:acetoin utilization protein AcuC [Pseudomonadota bacterium]